MLNPLIVIVISFAISLFALPLIIHYSNKKNIVAIPGRRRIHKRITPSLGGVGIFAGFAISYSFSVTSSVSPEIKWIISFVTGIFILGIVDDIFHLSAIKKLIGQLLIIGGFIFLSDIRIQSFYGLFGSTDLPYVFSLAISIIAMVIIINSFNLIDGLDGLASVVALLSSFSLAVWFYLIGENEFTVLLLALFGSVSAFLIFNWEPSSIFMGDTGSLVIGMILAIAIMEFLNTNSELPDDNIYKFDAPIATALCFIIVPLVDTARIIILRLYKKQSPFKPDKNHIHHTIVKLGMSHSQTVLILGSIHILFIALAVFFRNLPDVALLPLVTVIAAMFCIFLDKKILRRLSLKEAE